MKKITAEILDELESNQAFVEKMQDAANTQDIISILKEYGIETTEAELETVLANHALTTEDGELNEDALDNVSGGGWLWNWIKSWHEKLSKKNEKDINDIISRL